MAKLKYVITLFILMILMKYSSQDCLQKSLCPQCTFCDGKNCSQCPHGTYQQRSHHFEPQCHDWTPKPPGDNWIVKEEGTCLSDRIWDCKEGYEKDQFSSGGDSESFQCISVSVTSPPTTSTTVSSKTDPTVPHNEKDGLDNGKIAAISVTVIFIPLLILVLLCCCYVRIRKRRFRINFRRTTNEKNTAGNDEESIIFTNRDLNSSNQDENTNQQNSSSGHDDHTNVQDGNNGLNEHADSQDGNNAHNEENNAGNDEENVSLNNRELNSSNRDENTNQQNSSSGHDDHANFQEENNGLNEHANYPDGNSGHNKHANLQNNDIGHIEHSNPQMQSVQMIAPGRKPSSSPNGSREHWQKYNFSDMLKNNHNINGPPLELKNSCKHNTEANPLTPGNQKMSTGDHDKTPLKQSEISQGDLGQSSSLLKQSFKSSYYEDSKDDKDRTYLKEPKKSSVDENAHVEISIDKTNLSWKQPDNSSFPEDCMDKGKPNDSDSYTISCREKKHRIANLLFSKIEEPKACELFNLLPQINDLIPNIYLSYVLRDCKDKFTACKLTLIKWIDEFVDSSFVGYLNEGLERLERNDILQDKKFSSLLKEIRTFHEKTFELADFLYHKLNETKAENLLRSFRTFTDHNTQTQQYFKGNHEAKKQVFIKEFTQCMSSYNNLSFVDKLAESLKKCHQNDVLGDKEYKSLLEEIKALHKR